MLVLNIPLTHEMNNNSITLLVETYRDPISQDFQEGIILPW